MCKEKTIYTLTSISVSFEFLRFQRFVWESNAQCLASSPFSIQILICTYETIESQNFERQKDVRQYNRMTYFIATSQEKGLSDFY